MRAMLHIYAISRLLSMGTPFKFSTLGRHRGECRKPKNVDNLPDRAKGLVPFRVDGLVVWAGTLKGAKKKARLLKHFAP